MKILTVLIALLGTATSALHPGSSLFNTANPQYFNCPEPDDSFFQTSQQLAISANSDKALDLQWEQGPIDTWIHIYSANDVQEAGSVLDDHISDLMAKINTAFIETPFRFQLSGINRTIDSKLAVYRDKDGYKLAPFSIGDYTTLNLFLLDYRDSPAACSTPTEGHSRDVDHGCSFLSSLATGEDEYGHNIFVHEIGHWLGLAHTFIDLGKTCAEPDADHVQDTPKHLIAWGHDVEFYNCLTNLSTCGYKDPVKNYMNYMPSKCMSDFTPGQIVRMQQWWEIRKKAASGD